MKKSNQLIILVFAIALLIGCNKKSTDSISPATSALVGKWKDGGLKGSITVSIAGQTATEPLDEEATNETFELKADGTITESGSGFGFTKYKSSGVQVTFTILENGKTYDIVFNYAISGNTLTLSMDKALFIKNLEVQAKADPTADLADLIAIKDAITAISYVQTLLKQ